MRVSFYHTARGSGHAQERSSGGSVRRTTEAGSGG